MASQNLPFSGPTTTNDLGIYEANPGVQYGGTETNALYYEHREVAGVFYRVQNATYNAYASKWLLVNPALPAYALATTTSGTTQFLTAAANASPFSSWSVLWSITNGGVATGLTVPVGAGTVNTSSIVPGAITQSLIANGAVGPAQVATGAPGTGLFTTKLTVFNAVDYGADPTGVADSTTAIQSAITAAVTATGGIVYLPPGTYKITSTLTLNGSNVRLIGAGGGGVHSNSPGVDPATEILWYGGASPAVTVTSSASGVTHGGAGVRDLCIYNTNGSGTIGLNVDTVQFGIFDGFVVVGFTQYGLFVGETVAVGDSQGSQDNVFSRFRVETSTGGDGIRLQAASHNEFRSFAVDYQNGNGITVDVGDFNSFYNYRGYRQGGGTGYGVLLLGGTAYSNRFYECSPGAGCFRAYPGSYATIYTYDSTDNSFANPTVDPAGPNVSTTIAAGVSAGTQTVTPGSMASITVGSFVRIDGSPNFSIIEDVKVTAITGSTFTATFRYTHAAGVTVTQSPSAQLPWISDVGDLNGFAFNGVQLRPTRPNGSASYYTLNAPAIAHDGAAVGGIAFTVPTGSTNGYTFLVNGAPSGAKIDATGSVFGFNITASNSFVVTTNGPTWSAGSGVPAYTAPVGSLYSRTGGAVGSTLYVSRGGGTWNAVAGV